MWLLVLAYFVADTLVAIFECNPIAFYWDKAIKGGTCIDQNAFYRWNGVANLLIDFSILVLPMMMVWRLKLDLRSKITLTGVFLLGTLYVSLLLLLLHATLPHLSSLFHRTQKAQK